ncbi:hypothetical protein QG37_08231 [Candidozyma auris]|uniref:Uncharacterized protein n=1 Tax=Candidozyma auris TaxID=498019 RepID=A0A0L0NN70_CANAR|nr:hypothetical protein QG37_08231 [[Candida] auris]
MTEVWSIAGEMGIRADFSKQKGKEHLWGLLIVRLDISRKSPHLIIFIGVGLISYNIGSLSSLLSPT